MTMKYKIKYLPIANKDILAIDEALAEYPGKAKRLFQEMDKKLKLLEDMPHMWSYYSDNLKYRKMILEDYLLFYLVDDKAREIRVYRVLYSRMDIPPHIDE